MRNTLPIDAELVELTDAQAREVVGGPTAVEYFRMLYGKSSNLVDGTGNTLLQ